MPSVESRGSALVEGRGHKRYFFTVKINSDKNWHHPVKYSCITIICAWYVCWQHRERCSEAAVVDDLSCRQKQRGSR